MVPQQRVSSDGLADGRSKDLPFLCLLSSFASLSLLILASAPEEDYVGLVPLMPRPSFLGALSSQGVSDGARIEAVLHSKA